MQQIKIGIAVYNRRLNFNIVVRVNAQQVFDHLIDILHVQNLVFRKRIGSEHARAFTEGRRLPVNLKIVYFSPHHPQRECARFDITGLNTNQRRGITTRNIKIGQFFGQFKYFCSTEHFALIAIDNRLTLR